MTTKKDITIWYCYNKEKNIYEFNHFTEGLIQTDKPIPYTDKYGKPFKSQLVWKTSKWQKKFAKLIHNTIVY